jgi:pseudolysin
LNEAFSDMAAQAAEFYSQGKNTWMIGSEISKVKGTALRYMDMPSKDCVSSAKPGNDCSIDSYYEYPDLIASSKKLTAGDQRDSYVVHLASGVFNRVFYLISTADGWDPRKAFEVMIQANANYWTAASTFEKAACGVLKATKDLKYDAAAAQAAFKTVGISTKKC